MHYPSDILAGYLAGFVWATACVLAIELVRVVRDRQPELAREEADLGEGLRPVREAVRGGGER